MGRQFSRFPDLGHPGSGRSSVGSARAPARVFPGTPPPSVLCRPRPPRPPPPWPASAAPSSLSCSRRLGAVGRVSSSSRCDGATVGWTGEGKNEGRTLTRGVHVGLCLLLGGEEPLDPVLRFHGAREKCRLSPLIHEGTSPSFGERVPSDVAVYGSVWAVTSRRLNFS